MYENFNKLLIAGFDCSICACITANMTFHNTLIEVK